MTNILEDKQLLDTALVKRILLVLHKSIPSGATLKCYITAGPLSYTLTIEGHTYKEEVSIYPNGRSGDLQDWIKDLSTLPSKESKESNENLEVQN